MLLKLRKVNAVSTALLGARCSTASQGDPAIVGFARTAKISGLAPANEPADVVRSRRMDYFRAMAGGASPSAAVIEDVDYPKLYCRLVG
jgi:hypothetical protein